MSRMFVAPVLLLGLAAGGCATPSGPLTAGANPSVNSVHQPVVQRTDYVFDLATNGDSVPPAEIAKLRGWLDAIGIDYGDRIALDMAPGYESPGVRRDIARAVGEYGLLVDSRVPGVTAGPVNPGTVRVVASRATATVDGCPAWVDESQAPSVNTSSNFGCGVNSNIAAMVADPNDLVVGRSGMVGASGRVATRAIRVYRDRQPSGTQPLPSSSTTSGSSGGSN